MAHNRVRTILKSKYQFANLQISQQSQSRSLFCFAFTLVSSKGLICNLHTFYCSTECNWRETFTERFTKWLRSQSSTSHQFFFTHWRWDLIHFNKNRVLSRWMSLHLCVPFNIDEKIDIGDEIYLFLYFSGWKKTNVDVIWNNLFGKPFLKLVQYSSSSSPELL